MVLVGDEKSQKLQYNLSIVSFFLFNIGVAILTQQFLSEDLEREFVSLSFYLH